MGEGREINRAQAEQNSVPGAPRASGAVRVTTRGPVLELYFPPLRAAGAAVMLALFGASCGVIGAAAMLGLMHSSGSGPANLLAVAFAGVFALPLMGAGVCFITVALWTAANSVTVSVSTAGLQTERRCLGYSFARRALPRDDITAIDAQFAARYASVFGAARCYRLIARGRARTLLIADSLKGPDAAENLRNVIIGQLGVPELAAASNKVPSADGR